MRIGEIERIGERELPQWEPERKHNPIAEPPPHAVPIPEKEPEKVN